MAILKVNILPKEEKKPDYEVGFEDGKAVGYDKGFEDGGYDRGYEKGYTEGNEKGFKDGVMEGQESGASLFGIINEVTGTNIATCDYVNENPHNVEVKLSSDTVADFSGVEVVAQSANFFDISKFKSSATQVCINNGDGSITMNQYQFSADSKISECCPSIQAGQTIIISAVNPGRFIWFGGALKGYNFSFEVTQAMLDNDVLGFYGKDDTTPDNPLTISNIMINVGNTPLPYEPYFAETYTANADGTVDGVTSISPTMNIICDTEGVNVSAKYYCSPTAEYDRFWDNYQEFGNRTLYSYAFYEKVWQDILFRPKYDITPTTASSIFENSIITDVFGKLEQLGINLDFSNCTNAQRIFYAQKGMTYIGRMYLPKCNTLQLAFAGTNIQRIEEIKGISINCNWNSCFNNSSKLQYIKLVDCIIGNSLNMQWCSLLDVESAKNILQSLANFIETKPFANTIYFHADVWDKLKADGNTSPNNNSWEDYLQDIGWNKG